MRRRFRRHGRLRNTRPQLFPVTNEWERDQRLSWIHSALVLRECRSHKFFIPPLLPIGGANLRGTPNLWAGWHDVRHGIVPNFLPWSAHGRSRSIYPEA